MSPAFKCARVKYTINELNKWSKTTFHCFQSHRILFLLACSENGCSLGCEMSVVVVVIAIKTFDGCLSHDRMSKKTF